MNTSNVGSSKIETTAAETPAPPTECRCSACNTRFFIFNRDHFELKYKSARFHVTGEVIVICRKCGSSHRFRTEGKHHWRRMNATD